MILPCVCVPVYPSTSSPTSVRAHPSILESYKFCGHKAGHIRDTLEILDTAAHFFPSSSRLLSSLSRRRLYLPSAIFWTSRGHGCRPFPPPGTCLYLFSRTGFSIPIARQFPSRSSQLTLSRFPLIIFYARKSPYADRSMHSVRLEPTKLILMSTWSTYQATGDAVGQ